MFKLKIENKKEGISVVDLEDESVSEALETIYSDKDFCIMNWNNCLINVSLKYDISDMYNDIVKMLTLLDNNLSKDFSIHFPSSSFFVQWDFNIHNEKVNIKAHWMAIWGGQEKLEELRKIDNNVVISKDDFISEWHRLLKEIKEDLLKVGYTEELENFEYLKKLK